MTQEALKIAKAITKPNTITFHNNINADWVMRITADRRIEVNEDVEVTEAAQKVLDAMQYLLKAQRTEQEPVKYSDYEPDGVHHNKPPQRTWVGLTDEQIEDAWRKVETGDFYDCVQPFARAIEAELKGLNP